MNKKQLIAQLSGSLNLSKADAERTFDTITNTILDALKGDDTVKIAGFGTYKVAKRKARVGRNPRTGEQIQIGASQKVKFLPAKSLKEMFNKYLRLKFINSLLQKCKKAVTICINCIPLFSNQH